MKKGFTLMEILAVMLVIAVIASFLVPAVRSVRAEIYYHRAKTAAIKMAEAMRSYYKDSKGYLISGVVNGLDENFAVEACSATSAAKKGIPPEYGSKRAGGADVMELFNCNYLTWKDFQGLPYTFTPMATSDDRSVLVRFTAVDETKAGRYARLGPFDVTHSMQVIEDESSF